MDGLCRAAAVLAVYSSGNVASKVLHATGLMPAAAVVDELKPAYSWTIALAVISSFSPVLAQLTAGSHVLGALAISRSNNPLTRRYALYPAVGSAIAVFLLSQLHFFAAPMSGTLVALVAAVHLGACATEVIWRMVFPAPLITPFVNLTKTRDMLLRKNIATPVDVPSSVPGVTLSGAVVKNPQAAQRRWIVYLGGNGEIWEFSAASVKLLAEKLDANALLVNFRGAGESGGVVRCAGDMVQDADDAVAFLTRTYDCSDRDVVLFGHSIGGGVAAQLAATRRRELGLVIDRSFSSLTDAAASLVGIPRFLTAPVVTAVFGDLNTAATWAKIPHERKLVTFHRGDRVIAHKSASLARLKAFDSGPSAKYVVEYTGRTADAHNCDMQRLQGHEAVIRTMRGFFQQ